MSFLAEASACLARALAPFPHVLRWYLSIARNYVDWRGDSITCRTSFGATMRCRLCELLQRKVAYFGVWEPNLTAYFQRALRPGDTLVDVGANIGYYSLLGSSLAGPAGKVIAIEAGPTIFALLQQNLAMNRCTNVRAVNCAAAYENGTMSTFIGGEDNIGRSSTAPADGNVFTGTVDARPLHEILTRDEMAAVRLIKIDIEGAEGPVVKSILENIALYNPHCEIALEVSVEGIHLLEDLSRHGFHAYLIENAYDDMPYIRRDRVPPRRFTGKIVYQTDFIFSRKDAETL